jgi:hypothetical protein
MHAPHMLHAPSCTQFFYYFLMFLETIAFYNIFGQFLVYITPNQAIAQVPPCDCSTASLLCRQNLYRHSIVVTHKITCCCSSDKPLLLLCIAALHCTVQMQPHDHICAQHTT